MFTYHSIEEEIPEPTRPVVRMVHYSFIITVVALFWNFIAATAAAFKFGAAAGWFMSVIYLGAGAPLAWYLWYRRLYSACKHDSALGFLWFFLVYLVHIGFCLYAFLGMGAAEYSTTGVENWQKAEKGSAPVGFMYLAGMILFLIDTLVSINAIRMVYLSFARGGTRSRRRRSRPSGTPCATPRKRRFVTKETTPRRRGVVSFVNVVS